jgi:hypothetical protein
MILLSFLLRALCNRRESAEIYHESLYNRSIRSYISETKVPQLIMASSTQSARLPPLPLSWPFLLLLISTLQLRVVGADISSRMSSTPSPVKSAPSQVYTVKVGLADHKFEPDVIVAGVGDVSSSTYLCLHNIYSSCIILGTSEQILRVIQIVEFHFYPANHSVVRAEFDRPCVPYEMTGSGKTGFFSNFHPVDSVLDNVCLSGFATAA